MTKVRTNPPVAIWTPTKYRCRAGHEHEGSAIGMELNGRMVLVCPTCLVLFAVSQGWEAVEVKE
jgi:hypothetical protein